MEQVFDVAIIGGGINGCSIAAAAASLGLKVILLEKDDLASKTSSSSTKLIHGGLRYLEHYHFALVKKSLDERQALLEFAPHLISPLPFIIPHHKNMRSRMLIRAGLFLYDHLSLKNKLPKSKVLDRSKQPEYFLPLQSQFTQGFLYYDCLTDDARLTLENALHAKKKGALILTQTELIEASVTNNLWVLTTQTKGLYSHAYARLVINVAGPWVEKVNQRLQLNSSFKISLVKGSHFLLPKLYEGNYAYLLQNKDKRVVFVIPYYDYSLIGTTDVALSENLDAIAISEEEIMYLFASINTYFTQNFSEKNIVATWSGVRPLLFSEKKSLQALSRDYQYEFIQDPTPAIIVYGGKITTHRQLAFEIMNKLSTFFSSLPEINSSPIVPGAYFPHGTYDKYVSFAKKKYAWLPEPLLNRFLHTYGVQTDILLKDCSELKDLGKDFGHGLFQREVDYLVEEEWATCVQDILWRRTKLGFSFSDKNIKQLTDYLDSKQNR